MNTYTVYLCTGKGKFYREAGTYTTTGKSYLEAATSFANRYNKVSFYSIGNNWKSKGQKRNSGYPKFHQFIKGDGGYTLLLIPISK